MMAFYDFDLTHVLSSPLAWEKEKRTKTANDGENGAVVYRFKRFETESQARVAKKRERRGKTFRPAARGLFSRRRKRV